MTFGSAHPRRLAIALALAAATVGPSACGGGDDDPPNPRPSAEPTPTASPAAVDSRQANLLPLDTPRAEVERQLGKPLRSAEVRARVPREIIRGEPKRTVCVYYGVTSGRPEDFFQFCYRNGKLGSKLSLLTEERGAVPATEPPPGVTGTSGVATQPAG